MAGSLAAFPRTGRAEWQCQVGVRQALGHTAAGHSVLTHQGAWLPGAGLGCCDGSRAWATGTCTLMAASFLEKVKDWAWGAMCTNSDE